ncbi:MAG: redoxin family protein [Candidatus Hydrogenedentes bacterium]|nr:redoxin family protein [Candidatus Hydrogenedentota bacterium]
MSEERVSKVKIIFFVWGYLIGVLSCILFSLAFFFLVGYPLKYYLAKKGVESLKKPVFSLSSEFDYSLSVVKLNGEKQQSLKDLKGKSFFAFFWHPDCIHCLSTLITVDSLNKRLGEKFPVVSFTSASPEVVSQTLDNLSCSVPVYLLSGDRFESLTGGNVPQGIVVDSSGKVIYKYVGSAKWDDEEIIQVLLSFSS